MPRHVISTLTDAVATAKRRNASAQVVRDLQTMLEEARRDARAILVEEAAILGQLADELKQLVGKMDANPTGPYPEAARLRHYGDKLHPRVMEVLDYAFEQ